MNNLTHIITVHTPQLAFACKCRHKFDSKFADGRQSYAHSTHTHTQAQATHYAAGNKLSLTVRTLKNAKIYVRI